ncbi:MAG: PilZ domain-containing protein [Allosphingosinicella sp.]
MKPLEGPVSRKETCRRRKVGGTLIDIAVARAERRRTNQRREDRFHGQVERATILFRRKKLLVRVVNVSAGGVMIETGIIPRIGEAVGLQFDGFDRLEAIVRWVRRGRIGLDVGEDAIDVG